MNPNSQNTRTLFVGLHIRGQFHRKIDTVIEERQLLMLLQVKKHRPSCMFFQAPFELTHDFYKVLHVFAGYRAVCFDSSIDSVKIQNEAFRKTQKTI